MAISFQPMGDQAVLASFADENTALRFAAAVRRTAPRWLVDLVQAYTTVAIFFNLDQTTYAKALAAVEGLSVQQEIATPDEEGKLHRIPCCYGMHQDLDRVADSTGLSAAEVVRMHSSTVYTVYAIGFCPGFPYLGYLPDPLCGVPRLATPRLRVEPGSVGLTGRQTGIYTEPRPGGWSLIGRTPLELVNVSDGYFPLRTGDRVQFVPIDEGKFNELLGRRLDQI